MIRVLIVVLLCALSTGCYVVRSDDPAWEYPVNYGEAVGL